MFLFNLWFGVWRDVLKISILYVCMIFGWCFYRGFGMKFINVFYMVEVFCFGMFV